MPFANNQRVSFIKLLLGILLFFGMLYFGRVFLIPLAISGLFAMLLLPICSKLEKWKWPKALAALTSSLIIVIIISGVITLLLIQISSFANDLPELQETAGEKLDRVYNYIAEVADVSPDEQKRYLQQQVNDFFGSVTVHIKNLLMTTSIFFVYFILVIVYTFLFLLYRNRLEIFILKMFDSDNRETKIIIDNITSVANSYITGVFIVVLILAVINSIGLYLIGIEHAIFLGVLAGILNIIPFIGSLAGSLIPVLIALLTKDSIWYAVAVAIFFFVVQEIESYLLTPRITGSKVKLNPLATISVLMLGSLVWGIAGMILFIPYLGILKVILDHVPHLKPYGYVIGREDD
jgi:predicted PurR-regulated permease PerM